MRKLLNRLFGPKNVCEWLGHRYGPRTHYVSTSTAHCEECGCKDERPEYH